MTRRDDLRVFLAVPVPQAARKLAAAFLETARRNFPDVRWCDPAGLHVTLHFFGYASREKITLISDCARETASCFPSFSLGLSGLGAFPDEHHPRILWAGITGARETLFSLHSDLEKRLETLGFETESRPYTPHVTLGRAHRHPCAEALRELVLPPAPEEPLSEIALYESRSTDQGSHYEILQTFALAGTPGN